VSSQARTSPSAPGSATAVITGDIPYSELLLDGAWRPLDSGPQVRPSRCAPTSTSDVWPSHRFARFVQSLAVPVHGQLLSPLNAWPFSSRWSASRSLRHHISGLPELPAFIVQKSA